MDSGVLRLGAVPPLGDSGHLSAAHEGQTAQRQGAVKPAHSIAGAIALLVFSGPVFAGTPVTASVDAGGGRSASASYVNDASLGGIGGISSAGSDTARHGYVGQLTEVDALSLGGMPAPVNEGGTSQLRGTAVLDDDSVTVLVGSEIAWGVHAYPLESVDGSGLATAAIVYSDAAAMLNGSYLGVNGTGSLLVVDAVPDNYGSYAGDGLPDDWQHQYFGLNNANAGPTIDCDGDRQDNRFEYIAGLVPTNAASRFMLRIANVPGQANQKNLIFSPRWDDRTYTPVFRNSLVGGESWTNLTTTATADNGTERTVTDTDATQPQKFYRISISFP